MAAVNVYMEMRNITIPKTLWLGLHASQVPKVMHIRYGLVGTVYVSLYRLAENR